MSNRFYYNPDQEKQQARRNQQNERRRQATRRRNNSSRFNMNNKTIPAAQTTQFKGAKINTVKTTANAQTIILSGVDLVEPIPQYDGAVPNTGTIFATIPANPLYWKGTRIAAQASAYQQYRPLKFQVKYVPSVPVTVPGQIVYGTMWNVGVSSGAFQQSLATSNGGGISSCYQSIWSRVRCNETTLPLKYYNVGDEMSENTTCPFTWMAYYTGQSQVNVSAPGYVLIHWKYEFTVGIGQTARNALTYSNTSQEGVKDAMLRRNIKATIPWGVALGILKDSTITALRKIAIFLLDSTIAYLKDPKSNDDPNTVRVSKGNILSYDLDNLEASDSLFTVCSSNGTKYYISDETPVIIWQVGSEVQRHGSSPGPTPEPVKFKILEIQASVSNTTGDKVTFKWEKTIINGTTTIFKFASIDPAAVELRFEFTQTSNTTINVLGGKPEDGWPGDICNISMQSSWDGYLHFQLTWQELGLPKTQIYQGPPLDITELLEIYPVQ